MRLTKPQTSSRILCSNPPTRDSCIKTESSIARRHNYCEGPFTLNYPDPKLDNPDQSV